MPSISNSLSCGPISLSNSSEYERPEHPPPFTPILRKTVLGRFCACWSSFTCFTAASDNANAIELCPSPALPGRLGVRDVLLAVVRQRRLDRVLRQHRAVDLDRRQLQLVHDVRVLDLGRLVDRLPLEPLGGQARRRDGAAAAERLELRVLDDARLEVDLDLELHDVAALGRAHEPRPHARRVLGEGPDVARVVVVIDDLVAVSHERVSPVTRPSTGSTSGPRLPWPIRRVATSPAGA